MRRASESMKAAVSCGVCFQSCSGKALVSQCGLELLRKDTKGDTVEWYLAGPEDAFARLPVGNSTELLPLEDVFIELSGKARVDL